MKRFATALRRDLLGFHDLSLHRICPGLSLYVSVGLSPADVRDGLNRYLAAAGLTWLSSWQSDQAADQARYLIGILARARRAGYIALPDTTSPHPTGQDHPAAATPSPSADHIAGFDAHAHDADTEPCPHGVQGGARHNIATHGPRCPLCRSR